MMEDLKITEEEKDGTIMTVSHNRATEGTAALLEMRYDFVNAYTSFLLTKKQARELGEYLIKASQSI